VAESRRVQAAGTQVLSQADLRTARTAPEQVAVIRSRADSAEARVKLAQAAMEQSRLNLQYTTVKAPSAGVVSRKTVETGQVVQPGQPLLALVSLDDLWVTANFKETQLHDMRPGQPATIGVDAYGRTYKGRVDSIAAATGARFSLLPPENATGNYVKVVQRIPVKIVFEQGQDPQHLLRPGMSVVTTVLDR
jgi:membrane fusion protein (multidrug efflux system)